MIPTTIRRSGPALAVLAALPATALASSFQILEQSPSRLGTAFSGTASQADDATTVFFNPAGMSRLEGKRLTVGGNAIVVNSEFDDEGSTAGVGTTLQGPLPGTEDETDEPGLVPNLYYVQPINDRWTFGVGVNAPFGLASDYDDDWQGRYHATESELQTININPTFAFAVTDRLSLGFGLSYQHSDVTLENEVDSFNACLPAAQQSSGLSESAATGTCAAAHGGPANRSADSSVEIEGDDDDIVADLSLHWQATDRTAIGVTWRQGGDFKLEGDADFSASTSCAQDPFCSGGLAALDGDIEAEAEFPDTVTLSATHAYRNGLTVHADVAWTDWSVLQSIPIENTDSGRTVNELELEYDDTVRVALGATWNTDSPWTWRGGIAHDESPQTGAEYITPRIPDADRTWLSGGFNYAFRSGLSIDVGYTHLFVDDVSINTVEQGNRLRGDFEASVDLLAVQANWRF